MKHKLTLFVLILVTFGLGLLGARGGQDGMKATHVAGKVHLLEGGRGGNVAVSAGEDGLLLVDDQFADLADSIRATMTPLASKGLKFVLNTHWHGDHTGSNPVFGTEALILAHDNVRKRLSVDSQTRFGVTPALPPEGLPVVTYDQAIGIHFNGEEVRVLHYPYDAHTDGDSVVWFTGSNVIHMGDLFFNGGFPFIDLQNGGDVDGLVKTVDEVLEELPEDIRVIPGHGPVGTRADLEEYLDAVRGSRDWIYKLWRQGESLKEIQARRLPARFDKYGQGFIKSEDWIATVYEGMELSGRRRPR